MAETAEGHIRTVNTGVHRAGDKTDMRNAVANSKLGAHLQSDDKPHQCDFCGVKFKDKQVKDLHEQLHYNSGEGDEEDSPQTDLSEPVDVKTVVEDASDNADPKPKQTPNKYCQLCDDVLDDNEDWAAHMKEHQNAPYDEPLHECNICGKAFVQKKELRLHKKLHNKTVKAKPFFVGRKYEKSGHSLVPGVGTKRKADRDCDADLSECASLGQSPKKKVKKDRSSGDTSLDLKKAKIHPDSDLQKNGSPSVVTKKASIKDSSEGGTHDVVASSGQPEDISSGLNKYSSLDVESMNTKLSSGNTPEGESPGACGKRTNRDVDQESEQPTSKKQNVERNIKKNGPKVKIFECNVCQKQYPSKVNLDRHKRIKHSQYPNTCSGCGLHFESDTELKVHKLEKHPLNSKKKVPKNQSVDQPVQQPSPQNKCNEDHEDAANKEGNAQYSKANATVDRSKNKSHYDSSTFDCTFCGKSVSTMHLLLDHIRTVHPDRPRPKCDKCPRTFLLEVSLDNHKKTAHGEPDSHGESRTPYPCPVCEKSYTLKANLARHMRVRHPDQPKLKCDLCTSEFWSESGLEIHEHDSHYMKDSPPTSKNAVCPVCGKGFAYTQTAIKHIHAVHPEQPRLKCDECHKSYWIQSSLDDHKNAFHTGESHRKVKDSLKRAKVTSKMTVNMFPRKVHGKQVKSAAGVTRDTTSGPQRKPSRSNLHKCRTCGKKFLSKLNLVQHKQRRHKNTTPSSPARPHTSHGPSVSTDQSIPKCTVCGQEFQTQFALSRHMLKRHPEALKFRCDSCDKAFLLEEALEMHQVDFHGLRKTSELRCLKCQSKFHSEKDMEKHDCFTHPPSNLHKCPTCSKEFSDEHALMRHEHQCHQSNGPTKSDTLNDKPHKQESNPQDNNSLQCPICSKDFQSQKGLALHMRNMHPESLQFKCECCGEAFFFEHTMILHLKKVHNMAPPEDHPGTCDVCGKLFSTEDIMVKHMWDAHLQMEAEEGTSESESPLEQQTIDQPEETATDQSSSRCTICGKTALSLHGLALHMRHNHPEHLEFKCDVCNQGFFAKSTLERHLQNKHHQRVQSQDKSITVKPSTAKISQRSPKGHQSESSGLKEIKGKSNKTACEALSTSDKLNQSAPIRQSVEDEVTSEVGKDRKCQSPVNTHDSESCTEFEDDDDAVDSDATVIDDQVYPEVNAKKSPFNNHLLQRSPEKETFGMVDVEKDSVKGHQPSPKTQEEIPRETNEVIDNDSQGQQEEQSVGGLSDEIPEETDGYVSDGIPRCYVCEKEFPTQDTMLKHIEEDHFHTFTCEFCQKSFKKKDNMRVHRERMHLRKGSFPCSACQKIFSTKGENKTHVCERSSSSESKQYKQDKPEQSSPKKIENHTKKTENHINQSDRCPSTNDTKAHQKCEEKFPENDGKDKGNHDEGSSTKGKSPQKNCSGIPSATNEKQEANCAEAKGENPQKKDGKSSSSTVVKHQGICSEGTSEDGKTAKNQSDESRMESNQNQGANFAEAKRQRNLEKDGVDHSQTAETHQRICSEVTSKDGKNAQNNCYESRLESNENQGAHCAEAKGQRNLEKDGEIRSPTAEKQPFICADSSLKKDEKNQLKFGDSYSTRGENDKKSEKTPSTNKNQHGGPATCPICGNSYTRRYNMLKHFAKHHKKPQPHTISDSFKKAKQITNMNELSGASECPNNETSNIDALNATKPALLERENSLADTDPNTCFVPQTSHLEKGVQEKDNVFKTNNGNVPSNYTFHCAICGEDLPTEQALEKHEEDVHLRRSACLCNMCGKEFWSEDDLVSHMRQTHAAKPKHKCNTCCRLFVLEYSLVRHKCGAPANQNLYDCPMCKQTFAKEEALRDHQCTLSHISSGQRILGTMVVQYAQDGVDLTKVKEEQDLDKVETTPSCLLCSKTFASQSELQEHNAKVHLTPAQQKTQVRPKQSIYKCFVCHMVFNQREDRKKHSCSPAALVDHERTMWLLNNPMVEDECDKEDAPPKSNDNIVSAGTSARKPTEANTPKKTGLNDHKISNQTRENGASDEILRPTLPSPSPRKWLKVKLYSCYVCGHAFRSPDQLANHMTIHTPRKRLPRPGSKLRQKRLNFQNGSNETLQSETTSEEDPLELPQSEFYCESPMSDDSDATIGYENPEMCDSPLTDESVSHPSLPVQKQTENKEENVERCASPVIVAFEKNKPVPRNIFEHYASRLTECSDASTTNPSNMNGSHDKSQLPGEWRASLHSDNIQCYTLTQTKSCDNAQTEKSTPQDKSEPCPTPGKDPADISVAKEISSDPQTHQKAQKDDLPPPHLWKYTCPSCKMEIEGSLNLVMHIKSHKVPTN